MGWEEKGVLRIARVLNQNEDYLVDGCLIH